VKNKKHFLLIINSCFIILLGWLTCKAFYELFINKPGQHFARINFSAISSQSTNDIFYWNVPTIAGSILFISGIISICVSVLLFIKIIFHPDKRNRSLWLTMIIGTAICILSMAYWMLDFMATSFVGVG
jgi:hypothetical protein